MSDENFRMIRPLPVDICQPRTLLRSKQSQPSSYSMYTSSPNERVSASFELVVQSAMDPSRLEVVFGKT